MLIKYRKYPNWAVWYLGNGGLKCYDAEFEKYYNVSFRKMVKDNQKGGNKTAWEELDSFSDLGEVCVKVSIDVLFVREGNLEIYPLPKDAYLEFWKKGFQ